MRALRAAAALCSLISVHANSNLTDSPVSQQILPSTFSPPQVFKNVNLLRSINLEKSYARETINIVIENVDTAPQSEYYLPFDAGIIGKVGGLEAADKKAPEKGRYKVEVVEYDPNSPTQFYLLHFPTPLAPSSQLTLSISYHVLSSLTPLPAAIAQSDKQYVVYPFSAYVLSAYPILKQKTKLKLPTTDVPDHTSTSSLVSSGSEDPQKQGSTFTYGPYDTALIPPGMTHPVSVRYEYTKPLTVATLLERDLEVSHWGGNFATEERYWLTNEGASLSKPFSRVTWATTQYYNPPTSALKELKVPLAPGSCDPYFTDDIGNVSTSRFRPGNAPREAMLELKPRYPVFGGWAYSFRIGWNNALSSFLRRPSVPNSDYTHILKVPFLEGPKMPEGVQYRRVQVRVILPEGATNVKYQTSIQLSGAETSLHKTFMDTLGRTSLKLTALNVVDDGREVSLIVTYNYPPFAALRKPLTVFAAALAVFVTAWGIGRIDVSIRKR